MTDANNEKWISLEEAAEYLSVKPITIRNWIKKGSDLPAQKIVRKWAFKCSELDEWVKSGKSAIK